MKRYSDNSDTPTRARAVGIMTKSELSMLASEVLYRLTLIARADIGDFIDAAGNITLKQGNRWLVKRFRKRGNTTTIELHDRLKALILLARYHGLLSGKVLTNNCPNKKRHSLIILENPSRR